jgi:hypothetical protein
MNLCPEFFVHGDPRSAERERHVYFDPNTDEFAR